MCQYLFAAFSLKQSADEGLTEDELAAVSALARQISHVATEEMLHLALVHNLLSAIGAAPHLSRPNLPAPPATIRPGCSWPCCRSASRRCGISCSWNGRRGWTCRTPRAWPPSGGRAAAERAGHRPQRPGLRHGRASVPVDRGRLRAPGREVRGGLAVHRAAAGAGHPGAFGWPNWCRSPSWTAPARRSRRSWSRARARAGTGGTRTSASSSQILDEYQQMREANPGFDPVRPVMAANVRPHERGRAVPLITDPLTARVTDLFNVGYEILLQIFERFFAHTQETDTQLKVAGGRAGRADGPGDQAARRPDHHAAGGPGVPGAHRRAQLRAVLRDRLPDAAPARGLGAAGRAAGQAAWLCERTVRRAAARPSRPSWNRCSAPSARSPQSLAAHLAQPAPRRPPWRRPGRGCWPPTSTPWPRAGHQDPGRPARQPAGSRRGGPRGRRTAQPRGPHTSAGAAGAAPAAGDPEAAGRSRAAAGGRAGGDPPARRPRPGRPLPRRAHRSGRGPAGRAAPGRTRRPGTGVARRSPAGAVRACRPRSRPPATAPTWSRTCPGPQPPGDRHPAAPPQLALCRCGASAVKPACDGTCHSTGSATRKTPTGFPTAATPTPASR